MTIHNYQQIEFQTGDYLRIRLRDLGEISEVDGAEVLSIKLKDLTLRMPDGSTGTYHWNAGRQTVWILANLGPTEGERSPRTS